MACLKRGNNEMKTMKKPGNSLKATCLIFFICIPLLTLTVFKTLNAEEVEKTGSFRGHHSLGAKVYTFSGETKVYEKPNVYSGVLAVLPADIEMAVTGPNLDEFNYYGYDEKKTLELVRFYTRNDYTDFWYRISWKHKKGGNSQGYVWGGDLAKANIYRDMDNDGKTEHLLVGIISYDRTSGMKTARLKLIRDEKKISHIDFRTVETTSFHPDPSAFGYDLDIDVIEKQGFTPPVKFVRMTFSYGACDFEHGQVFAAFSGERFSDTFTARQTNSADYGVTNWHMYIFPGDPGGKQNRIYELGIMTDKETNKDKIFSEFVYTWNEGRLEKRETTEIMKVPKPVKNFICF